MHRKPSPAFAGEGWVRVFFFLRFAGRKKKTLTLPPPAGPSLSREGGRGLGFAEAK